MQVYTYDSNDRIDGLRVKKEIEWTLKGIRLRPNEGLRYKTDEDTHKGVYSVLAPQRSR